MNATTCPQCGASFECCPQPDQRCWCLDLPALPAEMLGKDASGCYCPACLRAKLTSSLSSAGDLSSSLSLRERVGVGAPQGTTAGPHPSALPEGEGVKPGEARP